MYFKLIKNQKKGANLKKFRGPYQTNPNLIKLYTACKKNALGILAEADILFERGQFPLAFFLAVTAYEEVGKGQIVADYITGYIPKEEFEKAFRNHELKQKYNQRYIIIPGGKLEYKDCKTFKKEREASLYVGCRNKFKPIMPSEEITAEKTEEMINCVRECMYEIESAEFHEDRIGTGALQK